MSEVFYLKITKPGAGLCNQLYALAGCITFAMGRYNKIVIGYFLLDIETNGIIQFGSVFDIEHLNNWAYENCQLNIEEGQFNAHSYIESPIPFFGGTNNQQLFISVLRDGIKFKSYIIQHIENEIIHKIPITNKNIVIIHLRLEPDVVQHFFQKNENERICLTDMQIKYIDLIRLCCNSKNDHLIILSGNPESNNNNAILKYLEINNFSYYLSNKKCFNKREINGIADLILAEKLNCKQILGLYESSYTYTLIHRCLNNNCKATIMSYLHSGYKEINTSTTEYQRFK